MKLLWTALMVTAFLNADEIQRVEAIVKDITKLRVDYAICESQLETLDKEYESKIAMLENTILEQNKLLNKTTKERPAKLVKPMVAPKCEESNAFPKLMMKEKYAKVDEGESDKIETFKASAFRLNKTTSIYDGRNGAKIDSWEQGLSFTSDRKTKEKIKITGYFVNKIWTKPSQEMWVDAQDASKR